MEPTPDSLETSPAVTPPESAEENPIEMAEDTPTETPEEAAPAAAEEPPEELPAEPPAEVDAVPLPARRRRSPWLWIIGGVLLLLILAAGGGFLWLRSTESNGLKQAQDSLQAGNWAAAEAAADGALQYRSTGLLANPAALVLARGEARYHLAKMDLAMADLEEGKAADPASARPYLLQAQIQFDQGKLTEALNYAAEAQKRDDTLGFPYALQALQAYQQRNYAQALSLAGKAIDRDTTIAFPYHIRGSILSIQGSYAAALKDLSRALELQPGDVETLAWRAYTFLQNDKKEESLKDARAAQSAAPDSAAGLWAQAMASFIDYKNDDSLTAIDKAINKDGNRPEFYYLRAINYYKVANRADALADYEKAIQLAPDFIEAIFNRAWDLYSRYQDVDIEAEADRILKINPQSGLSSLLLASKYVHQRDWEKALAYQEQARAADPEDFHVYYNRGYIYLFQHDYKKATDDCNKAREIWPDATGPILCLADIQSAQKNYDQALELINKALQINPQNASVHTFKAAMLMAKKDNDGAKAEVEAALKIDPQSPNALRVRSDLAVADNDNVKAAADLNKALEASPNNTDVLLARGYIYLNMGNTVSATEDAQTVMKLNKYLPETQYLLFTINLQLRKDTDALQNAKTAAELDPNSSIPYLLMGEVYQSNGNTKLAITNLEKSIQIDPSDARAHYYLAQAHEDEGDFEAAAKDYQNLLSLKDQLTEDQITAYQDRLDFLQTIPKAVNGQRTVAVEGQNFAITYPVTWRQEPVTVEGTSLYLIKVDEEKIVTSSISVGSFPFEPGTQDASLTVTQLADYMNQVLAEVPSFRFISRKPIQANELKGIVDTFNLDQSTEDGSTTPISAQYYYFKTESEFFIIMFSGMPETFDADSKEVEKIAASLTIISKP